VLVVGSADPVGLTRLARGVADVHDLVVGATLRVVVNRMRPSLGWSAQEVIDTIATAAPAGIAGVHFLPDESSVVDRALVAGRTWTEVGDSALRRSVSELVDAVAPTTRSAARGRRARGRTGSRRRVRPRTAGRDRRW
jgi:hypothetical protein